MTAAAMEQCQSRLAAFDLGPTPELLIEEKKERLRAQRAEQQRQQEATWYAYAFSRARLLTSDERRDWYEVHSRYSNDRYHELHRVGIADAERLADARARVALKRTALGWPAGAKARRINL